MTMKQPTDWPTLAIVITTWIIGMTVWFIFAPQFSRLADGVVNLLLPLALQLDTWIHS
jgi:hypothetical protein